jgi:hypothetical protein
MGYEVLVRWILIVWSVLERRLQPAMRRLVSEIEAIRQMPAGRNEYLPPILISISDLLQQLSGNRQLRRSRQRNLLGVVSYPDALLRFQAGRLAVS